PRPVCRSGRNSRDGQRAPPAPRPAGHFRSAAGIAGKGRGQTATGPAAPAPSEPGVELAHVAGSAAALIALIQRRRVEREPPAPPKSKSKGFVTQHFGRGSRQWACGTFFAGALPRAPPPQQRSPPMPDITPANAQQRKIQTEFKKAI